MDTRNEPLISAVNAGLIDTLKELLLASSNGKMFYIDKGTKAYIKDLTGTPSQRRGEERVGMVNKLRAAAGLTQDWLHYTPIQYLTPTPESITSESVIDALDETITAIAGETSFYGMFGFESVLKVKCIEMRQQLCALKLLELVLTNATEASEQLDGLAEEANLDANAKQAMETILKMNLGTSEALDFSDSTIQKYTDIVATVIRMSPDDGTGYKQQILKELKALEEMEGPKTAKDSDSTLGLEESVNENTNGCSVM